MRIRKTQALLHRAAGSVLPEAIPDFSLLASMKPHPFERGNDHGRTSIRFMASRFNGATSFQTWKPV